MIVAVFRRRLKEGKTSDDFLEAWGAEKGFGVSTRVCNAVRLDDEREILTFGFVDIDAGTWTSAAQSVAELEEVRHDRIDDVVESTELRAFYDLRCQHDLTSTPREVTLRSALSLLSSLSTIEDDGLS
jgi:hypothetical protein